MINQYQTMKFDWTVKHQGSEVPFVSFESALSYANGLAHRGKWVKVIDPVKNTIRLESAAPVYWAESMIEEISGHERRRRLAE